MSIRAVIFDLDNTLTHRDLSVQHYARFLMQHYAEQFKGEFEQLVEIIRRIDRGGYPQKEQLTQPTIGGSVAEALLNELVWQQPPVLDELTAFWFEHFGSCAVAMPHAEQVLTALKQQGYGLAVISNGGHQTRLNILNGLGFTPYFDVIVSSEKVGLSKPRPEIFWYTAAQLNFSPSECLYVGDHPINDIQGAHQAGMRAVWLEGFHDSAEPIAASIQQLTQLQHYLNPEHEST